MPLPSGVIHIKGSSPGPKVGIIACTHGNEKAGLHAHKQLVKLFAQKKPIKGELVLIHNNLKATRLNKRFCDINMNRLPQDSLTQKSPKEYEVKRLQQLYPIIKDLDYVLDLHSTSAMPDPFVIILNKTVSPIAKKLGIPTIISNMGKIQKDKPFTAFCGGSKTVRIGVECGLHDSKESRKTALMATMNFLSELGFIKTPTPNSPKQKTEIFELIGSLMTSEKGYKLVRQLKPFEKLKKGEIVLTKKGSPSIKMAHHCQVLLPPKTRLIKYPNEEIFFTIKKI